jgi:hypothetical protein
MSPYDFNYVWVWRPEWESLPIARTPHGGDPAMNVIGLLWKPWKAGETEEAMGRPLLTLQTRNAA